MSTVIGGDQVSLSKNLQAAKRGRRTSDGDAASAEKSIVAKLRALN
jgi:hypothetical protein